MEDDTISRLFLSYLLCDINVSEIEIERVFLKYDSFVQIIHHIVLQKIDNPSFFNVILNYQKQIIQLLEKGLIIPNQVLDIGLIEKNLTIFENPLFSIKLDFHQLSRFGAVQIAARSIADLDPKKDYLLDMIVGKGLHSRGNQIIRERVEKTIDSRFNHSEGSYYQDEANTGILHLKISQGQPCIPNSINNTSNPSNNLILESRKFCNERNNDLFSLISSNRDLYRSLTTKVNCDYTISYHESDPKYYQSFDHQLFRSWLLIDGSNRGKFETKHCNGCQFILNFLNPIEGIEIEHYILNTEHNSSKFWIVECFNNGVWHIIDKRTRIIQKKPNADQTFKVARLMWSHLFRFKFIGLNIRNQSQLSLTVFKLFGNIKYNTATYNPSLKTSPYTTTTKAEHVSNPIIIKKNPMAVSLILFGDKFAEKSSFGNIYLGNTLFVTPENLNQSDIELSLESNMVEGSKRIVINTGVFEEGNSRSYNQIYRLPMFLQQKKQDIHLLVLVINGNNPVFSQGNKDLLFYLNNAFGPGNFISNFAVVSIRIDEDQSDEDTIRNSYMIELEEFLQSLLFIEDEIDIPLFMIDSFNHSNSYSINNLQKLHKYALSRTPLTVSSMKQLPYNEKVEVETQENVFIGTEIVDNIAYNKYIDKKLHKIIPNNGEPIRFSEWEITRAWREEIERIDEEFITEKGQPIQGGNDLYQVSTYYKREIITQIPSGKQIIGDWIELGTHKILIDTKQTETKQEPYFEKVEDESQVNVFTGTEREGNVVYNKYVDKKRQKITPNNGEPIRYSEWEITKEWREETLRIDEENSLNEPGEKIIEDDCLYQLYTDKKREIITQIKSGEKSIGDWIELDTRKVLIGQRRTEMKQIQRKQRVKEVEHHKPHSVFGFSAHDHTHYQIIERTLTESWTVHYDFDNSTTESPHNISNPTEVVIDTGRERGFTTGYIREIE